MKVIIIASIALFIIFSLLVLFSLTKAASRADEVLERINENFPFREGVGGCESSEV